MVLRAADDEGGLLFLLWAGWKAGTLVESLLYRVAARRRKELAWLLQACSAASASRRRRSPRRRGSQCSRSGGSTSSVRSWSTASEHHLLAPLVTAKKRPAFGNSGLDFERKIINCNIYLKPISISRSSVDDQTWTTRVDLLTCSQTRPVDQAANSNRKKKKSFFEEKLRNFHHVEKKIHSNIIQAVLIFW